MISKIIFSEFIFSVTSEELKTPGSLALSGYIKRTNFPEIEYKTIWNLKMRDKAYFTINTDYPCLRRI